MEDIKNISTLIVIIATIVNLYFVYQNYKAKKPVIDIKLENLPPYSDDKQRTILKLKNVGTGETGRDPEVVVSFSWIPGISYKCNFPSKGYRLDPNEEIIWKFRVDGNCGPESKIAVKVTNTNPSRTNWELHEQL